MKNTNSILLALSLFAFAACTDGDTFSGDGFDEPEKTDDAETGDTSGGEDNTYDHPGGPDVWDYLDRLAEEGPPSFSSRLHSCPKMKYATVGRLLESRGVNLNSGNELSAGFLWRNGSAALGAPKLDVRSRESTEITTAAAARLFDIFAQAAPEIIAAMPTLESCTVDGVGTEMFNAAGQCTLDGIACLTGVPATASHLELCNEMVNRATTPQKGQMLAVAALAAAAHTCE
jgi:hypothetical protein